MNYQAQQVLAFWRNVHRCIFRGRAVQCFPCMWSHCPKFTRNCSGIFFLGGMISINDTVPIYKYVISCLLNLVSNRSWCHLRSERPSFMHSPSLSEYLRRMLHYAGGSSVGHHAEFVFNCSATPSKGLCIGRNYLQIGSQKVFHTLTILH